MSLKAHYILNKLFLLLWQWQTEANNGEESEREKITNRKQKKFKFKEELQTIQENKHGYNYQRKVNKEDEMVRIKNFSNVM